MVNYRGFVEMVKSRREDKGFMAELRGGASKATRSKAWRHVVSFCDLSSEVDELCFTIVGAALASAKGVSKPVGNFGSSLRALGCASNRDTVEARFKRLLRCRTSHDVCLQLKPLLGLVRSKGVSVDYEKLLEDVHKWGEKGLETKRNWARVFYS